MQKAKLFSIKLPKITLLKEIPFIEKWAFGKKYFHAVIPLVILGIVGAIAIGAYSPLVVQMVQFTQSINNSDLKIKEYKDRIEQAKLLNEDALEKQLALLRRKFSPASSLSYILNSLTELGKSFNIEFNSINPDAKGKAEKDFKRNLQILPIGIMLVSEYKDFGDFMDSLSRLPDCFIVVKSYDLHKDEDLLPRLNIKLNLEACILEEAGGALKQKARQEETKEKGN